MAYLDFGRAVRGVDYLLRHHLGIVEFTDDEECIFRIAEAPAGQAVRLSDGTAVAANDPVLQLHWWNEHLPMIGSAGPSPAWATLMKRRMRRSLAVVAAHLQRERRYDAVQALTGATSFGSRLGAAQMMRTAQRFGFDLIEPPSQSELRGRVYEVLDSMLLWSLAWTFNPGALHGKGLLRHRHQLWISRARLMRNYCGAASAPAARRLSH